MYRKEISKITLLAFLVIAIAMFGACTREKDTGKATELRFGFTTEPSTFDPLNPANTADGRSILFNVFEGLVKPDAEGRLLPCIAESWTIEQDALVYNFTLRENIRFHDGSVLNSSDVKFSLDTAIAAGFSGLSNIGEVIITGDKLVKVILKSPDPEFLPYMTVGIVKDGNTEREKNITGTGPYFIESYTIQQNIIMKKFEDYWQRGLPHLEKITISFFANYDTLMIAMRAGSVDGTFITGAMASQLDQNQFDIFDNNSAAVHLLALNNAASPFNDIRVRRAVNYGINVQGIIDTAFFGAGSPSGSPIIPGLSEYYENGLSYPYNPDIARSLLAEAGYSAERKPAVEITVPSNFTMHVDTAQVIAGQLSAVGIDTTIKLVDWASWLSDVYFARQYQATIISLDSPNVSPRSFLTRYMSDNGSNFINFKNTDFDNAYFSALAENDSARRAGFYREAQRIIADNAASVYIQDILYFIALRSGAFAGVLNYPLYVIDFASIYGIDKN